MVVFECERCNESLKKPKVAKHISMCGTSRVSCIDCCKTFGLGEWEAHTSCISEAEKYQGKLFEAKNKVPKGQQKQSAWTECVQKAKESSPAALRADFEKLEQFDNVPRKYKAFANFMKNSVRIWSQNNINAIWEAIQKYIEESKPENPKPEPENIPQPNRSKRWLGWEEEAKDALQRNGGEMPWKKLRIELSERYTQLMASGTVKKRSAKEIELLPLASLPESWLREEDNLVRLLS